MTKTKVIFICTHNSARSQMAEAFLTRYAKENFDAYSAGYKPQPIHPYTYKVMQEIGIDISGQQPKDLWELAKTQHFGIIVTVCKKTEADCPTIPGVATRLYWNIEDPAAYEEAEEAKLAKFREVRDQIRQKTLDFLRERNITIKEG
jgi:arsenate reductase (thioredoxin)